MKTYLLFLPAALLAVSPVAARQPAGAAGDDGRAATRDTIVHIRPVRVYARGADLRRYRKLVAAVKKVYPVAKIARARMAEMEAELQRLPTRKAQKAYIRSVYHQIREEYTPIVKHMTRTQGRVLLQAHRPQRRTTPPTRCCANSAAASWRGSGRRCRASSGRTSNRSTTPRATTVCSNRSSATTKQGCSDASHRTSPNKFGSVARIYYLCGD